MAITDTGLPAPTPAQTVPGAPDWQPWLPINSTPPARDPGPWHQGTPADPN